MRNSCLVCVRKHIAKAIILLSESKLGYPQHLYLALGNLSEAEDEAVNTYPAFANRIRNCRLRIEKGECVDLLELIQESLLLDLEE